MWWSSVDGFAGKTGYASIRHCVRTHGIRLRRGKSQSIKVWALGQFQL